MVQKPLGIRILSVSMIVVSVVSLVFGYRLFVLFSPSFNIFVPFGGVSPLYWLSLVFVSGGLFGFIVSLGLWGMRQWAYYLTLAGTVVMIGFGIVLVYEGFTILYSLDVFLTGTVSISTLLVYGVTGSLLASLLLGFGLASIMIGVVVLRYLTGEVKYDFY
ncbi:MAG: hypothetical protein Q6352_003960 [Candidatus Freyrarchaeum guaymaensis]